MVTRGRSSLVNQSIELFKSQTWPNKELIIVAEKFETSSQVLLDSSCIQYKLIIQPKGLTLGDYRNLSVAHSSGEYLCIWDDDDLYSAHRITALMSTIQSARCSVVFNEQILIWWEERSILFLSGRRCWEGSMLAKRSCMGVYPSLQKGEDTFVSHNIMLNHKTALIQEPTLYCYIINGTNTCDTSHFENLLQQSTLIYEGNSKARILADLGLDKKHIQNKPKTKL